ncbi:unnamed protein product [Hyaloperonospora brassicae]|uniref:EGF-like domain-containing protein n=1 Tax=Hyaloperonospora brassicae TaxID=162125 RepID=A0AAV0UE47_HYABA|nr:unnamed protein product [Hyaloperonospora brassicae]
MHVWTVASALALVALSQQVAAKSKADKERPGICKETEDCAVAGYECVALQTTRSGTDTVKQCLPKVQDTDVCSGQFPGLCPTFSSWPSPYNEISSVCTYKPAEKCVSGKKASDDGVICVSGAKDSKGKSIDAIYGCVDFDTSALEVLFGEDEATEFSDNLGTTAALVENCLSTNATSNSTLLCSGQGTGDSCDVIDSNKCQLPGQCATGECNLETKECECAAGTTGDQCSECDPTSKEACNGKGTCAASMCECEEGWEGLHCTKESAVPKESKSSKDAKPSNSTATSSGTLSPRPMPLVAMAVVSMLTFALFQ